MFIRLVLFVVAIGVCIFVYVWLKNSKFLDNFLKDASVEPEYEEPMVSEIIEDIRVNKDVLKQEASKDKQVAKKAGEEASKIDKYLKK